MMSRLMRKTRTTLRLSLHVSLSLYVSLLFRLSRTNKAGVPLGFGRGSSAHTDTQTHTLRYRLSYTILYRHTRHTSTQTDRKHSCTHTQALTDSLGCKTQTNTWLHNHTQTPTEVKQGYTELHSVR